MQAVRHLIAQRHLAVLICAAALLMKLLVPTGYMIAADHGRVAFTLCSGIVPDATSADQPAQPAMHRDMGHHGEPDGHGKGEQPCAFAGLSAAVTGAVDPVQLAALIAFVIAVGLVATVAPPRAGPARLRPPLRGPPARP